MWDIYTVSPDGGGLVNLTRSPEDDVFPAWSPDHRRIAFYSARQPGGVYMMNADGSDPRFVGAYGATHLTWSPDGRRLAFVASSDNGADIFVVNDDGGGLKNITNSGTYESAPAWSPLGDRIAFHGGPSRDDIWVMTPTGSNRRNLTSDLPVPSWDPSWSPDGANLVFASNLDGPTNLYVMDTLGTVWKRLTITTGPADRVPAWSPDGSRIVFQRDFSDSVGVYVITVEGLGLRRLAGGISGQPAW